MALARQPALEHSQPEVSCVALFPLRFEDLGPYPDHCDLDAQKMTQLAVAGSLGSFVIILFWRLDLSSISCDSQSRRGFPLFLSTPTGGWGPRLSPPHHSIAANPAGGAEGMGGRCPSPQPEPVTSHVCLPPWKSSPLGSPRWTQGTPDLQSLLSTFDVPPSFDYHCRYHCHCQCH